MKKATRFEEFEKEPFSIQLMAGLSADQKPYEEYAESYEKLLSMVREGVEKGAISEKEGRSILQECRK